MKPTIIKVGNKKSPKIATWCLVDDSNEIGKDEFPGYIAPFSLKLKTDKPILYVEEWEKKPKLNDIILIDKTGKYSVLYDSESDANGFVVSDRCNLKCIMCPQIPEEKQTDRELFNIAKDTIELLPDNCEWICFTGGEPTLAWDNLIELIRLCTDKNINVQLLTNGSLFSRSKFAKELYEVAENRVVCGIPLYSDNAIDHDNIVKKNGAFYKTVKGMYNLESYGIPIELRNVYINQNKERLFKWAKFVYSTVPFVSRVVLMGLELMGDAKKNVDKLWAPVQKDNKFLKQVVIFFQQVGIDFMLFNFPLCLLPKEVHEYAAISISEWKREYFDKCNLCIKKEICGGAFSSSKTILEEDIRPFLS